MRAGFFLHAEAAGQSQESVAIEPTGPAAAGVGNEGSAAYEQGEIFDYDFGANRA